MKDGMATGYDDRNDTNGMNFTVSSDSYDSNEEITKHLQQNLLEYAKQIESLQKENQYLRGECAKMQNQQNLKKEIVVGRFPEFSPRPKIPIAEKFRVEHASFDIYDDPNSIIQRKTQSFGFNSLYKFSIRPISPNNHSPCRISDLSLHICAQKEHQIDILPILNGPNTSNKICLSDLSNQRLFSPHSSPKSDDKSEIKHKSTSDLPERIESSDTSSVHPVSIESLGSNSVFSVYSDALQKTSSPYTYSDTDSSKRNKLDSEVCNFDTAITDSSATQHSSNSPLHNRSEQSLASSTSSQHEHGISKHAFSPSSHNQIITAPPAHSPHSLVSSVSSSPSKTYSTPDSQVTADFLVREDKKRTSKPFQQGSDHIETNLVSDSAEYASFIKEHLKDETSNLKAPVTLFDHSIPTSLKVITNSMENSLFYDEKQDKKTVSAVRLRHLIQIQQKRNDRYHQSRVY